jgi:phosphotransferase system enzyme I (PtsP)
MASSGDRRTQAPATASSRVRELIRRVGRPSIHREGDARLDAILDLAGLLAGDSAVHLTLARLVPLAAAALRAEICSLYLREAGDVLVLRANHGFPETVVGHIQLRVGEGLTGYAVRCCRPVSVRRALDDPRVRYFPETGEERYPAFLAQPLLRGGVGVGALVFQRGAGAFRGEDIRLAAALAALVASVIGSEVTRAPTTPLRRPVRLQGTALASGIGIGRVMVQPQLTAESSGPDVTDPAAQVGMAIAQVALEIAELHARLRQNRGASAFLQTALVVVEDGRLTERLDQLVAAGLGPRAAVERVTREYARVAECSSEPFVRRRGIEVEAVLARILERVEHGPPGVADPGGILVCDGLDPLTVIEHAATRGVGICASSASCPPGLGQLCASLGLPLVVGVERLFAWASPGTLAVVDGERGYVILSPSRTELARYRRHRRARGPE